jgi:O-methyltransferase
MLKYLFSKFSSFLASKNLYIVRSLVYFKNKRVLPINLDYVRYSTLELCCDEIALNKVNGSIAELGVYKGEFAKRLNVLFPDRKLYLFDTFEGFKTDDTKIDQQQDYSSGEQNFSDTSVESVLAKMNKPENCIVKKGFFPETANDVNDTFAFVNIDTDLYQPILKGLEFFYPRLEKKGYIFIHDFNNNEYKGAREAVVKFCTENNIHYTPLPDIGGTVIITK